MTTPPPPATLVLAAASCLLASTPLLSAGVMTKLPSVAEREQLEPKSGPFSKLFDPQDGMLDLSGFLLKPMGFFPMVMPITEPAVGTGAALAPIFIKLPPEGKGMPSIWAAGAMRTSNGTQGYFGAYSGYHGENQRWHVMAAAADVSVNLDFHGLGEIAATADGEPLRYNLDGIGGLLGTDVKLGDSPWRAGLRYLYGEVDASAVRSRDEPLFENVDFTRRFGPVDLGSVISSVQTALSYDTRDNTFTPTKGLYSEASFTVNSEGLGGSSDYQIFNLTTIWYRPLVEKKLFFGLRGDYTQSFGEVPFYRRPTVHLRGAPAQRFQGDGVTYEEAELRWQFHKRWSLLAFGGAGFTWTGDAPFRRTDSTFTGGGGFRYLIARRHGLHAGVDVAYGEEGTAVYIQFGSAWFRP